MILFVTAPDDAHALHVARLIEQRRGEVVWFDPSALLTRPHSLHVSAGRFTFEVDGAVVSDATTAWYRRPSGFTSTSSNSVEMRGYEELETREFAFDALNALNCRWLPGPFDVLRRRERKLSQLRVASELGFEVPATLATRSASEAMDFFRAHDGCLISKLSSAALPSAQPRYFRFTTRVGIHDVGALAASFAAGEFLLQGCVPKRVELRVTVVGEQVFAAEIHSQETERTRTDWRRYVPGRTRYAAHALPPDVAARCVTLTKQLGLTFGAIDLVLTPDGRYVFLEINPNGQWLWVEHWTGLPIANAIADFLLS